MQLRNDNAFGPVDHKCALGSHQRKLTHVNFFFLRAAFVFVTEGHIERSTERLPLALGLESGHFGLTELIAHEVE